MVRMLSTSSHTTGMLDMCVRGAPVRAHTDAVCEERAAFWPVLSMYGRATLVIKRLYRTAVGQVTRRLASVWPTRESTMLQTPALPCNVATQTNQGRALACPVSCMSRLRVCGQAQAHQPCTPVQEAVPPNDKAHEPPADIGPCRPVVTIEAVWYARYALRCSLAAQTCVCNEGAEPWPAAIAELR